MGRIEDLARYIVVHRRPLAANLRETRRHFVVYPNR